MVAIRLDDPLTAYEVVELVEVMRPHLAGKSPQVQGAVLADLLAIWLAGHHVADDADATRKMRAEMLALHCQAVRQLVPVNAAMIGTTL